MKKQILNLGKALNRAEQQRINGGHVPTLYEFCCTRTEAFWVDAYPFLGNDPNYNCNTGGGNICN